MNRLVRQLLFMFGPLIFRQITKAMKKKNNTNQWNTPDSNRQQRQQSRSPQRPIKREIIDVEPVLSEEERNFNLEEEDSMLEEKDLKYVEDIDSTELDGEFESDIT